MHCGVPLEKCGHRPCSAYLYPGAHHRWSLSTSTSTTALACWDMSRMRESSDCTPARASRSLEHPPTVTCFSTPNELRDN